jgi:hypothetical protein
MDQKGKIFKDPVFTLIRVLHKCIESSGSLAGGAPCASSLNLFSNKTSIKSVLTVLMMIPEGVILHKDIHNLA